jgi:hypothetical protein
LILFSSHSETVTCENGEMVLLRRSESHQDDVGSGVDDGSRHPLDRAGIVFEPKGRACDSRDPEVWVSPLENRLSYAVTAGERMP